MRISDWSSDVCSSDLQIREALEDYVKRFNELIDQSTYFKRGTFTYYNASVIAKALADNGFFDAAHSIRLNADEKVEITSSGQLDELGKKEKEGLNADAALRKKCEIIEKLIHKTVSVRDFNALLAEHDDKTGRATMRDRRGAK